MWEPRPAANADSQPPERQKLRPEVGPPTKTVHAPSFVGAATRGECRLVATSKARASARGRASHKTVHAPSFVGAATRGECRLAATSKAKASARGRASHENSARTLICGSRDPRRMQTRSHLKSKSFTPKSGLPRKQCTRAHLWEARPAAKADSQPPEKQKLRSEVGPATKTVHARSFCGRRDPRRRQTRSHLKSKSFTRSRASHENSARALICGRRDPRRRQTRSHLKGKSFAPRAGLLHSAQPRASRFCGRHLKADECPPTVGRIGKRSARCDCHARWPSGSRPSPVPHPNSSSALPARRASRSNAEPRSDNAPG